MNRKLLFILLVLPGFLLSVVSVNAADTETDELFEIVKNYLPAKAELLKPNDPEAAHSIQGYDFDQDGQNEIVATFRVKDEVQKLHVIALKREGHQWKKILDMTGEGFGIEYFGFDDITGDGAKELLVAWAIGASAGSKLDVYRWENGTLKNIIESPFFHKMELLKEEEQTKFALWERYCCDAFTVDVLMWNGTRLVHDEKGYPEYYPKIEKFYKEKLEESDSWFYWYVLADAQLKANRLEEATDSIRKGSSYSLAKKEFLKLHIRLEDKTSSSSKIQ